MNSLTPKRESGFTRTLIVILIVMAALAVGYGIRIWMEPAHKAPQPSEDKTPPDVDKDILFWTCAMHPEIHQPGPSGRPAGVTGGPPRPPGDGR